MKESLHIENVKQIGNVGELRKLLEKYSDATELAAHTTNAITDLVIGTTHPVGDRDTEEEILLVFGGNED